MQLFSVVAVITALIILLIVMMLIIPCANKERYEVLNRIPYIKNIKFGSKRCDKTKFSIIYPNKEPNANFEKIYKIRSTELPSTQGNPCPCVDWCLKTDNCQGFRYVNNIRKGVDRCDFMSKEINESDLRDEKNRIYFQKSM